MSPQTVPYGAHTSLEVEHIKPSDCTHVENNPIGAQAHVVPQITLALTVPQQEV